MPKNTEINLGDTIWTYCESSPYHVFSGKVIKIEKTEELKRGKRIVQNGYCVIRENSKHTWGTYHPFLTEKEAALHCLKKQKEDKKFLLIQLENLECSIKNMKEILKKYGVEVEAK